MSVVPASFGNKALQMRIGFIAIPLGKRRSSATSGYTTERPFLMPNGEPPYHFDDRWAVAAGCFCIALEERATSMQSSI